MRSTHVLDDRHLVSPARGSDCDAAHASIVNSFQTTLTPNPEKLYKCYSVIKEQKPNLECALQMLSSSGASGLEIA